MCPFTEQCLFQVVSPSELWLQLTSDPENTLNGMSEQIVEAKPPRLKEVGQILQLPHYGHACLTTTKVLLNHHGFSRAVALSRVAISFCTLLRFYEILQEKKVYHGLYCTALLALPSPLLAS